MKTYMLVLWLVMPLDYGTSTMILDYNLTWEDCVRQRARLLSPHYYYLSCEPEWDNPDARRNRR